LADFGVLADATDSGDFSVSMPALVSP